MLSQLTNLNWITVLIAFAAYCMLGGLWFTVLFEKWYKSSLGRAGETLPNKPIFIVGPALCTLVVTLASAILIYTMNLQSVTQALEFSFLVGVGFLVANTVNIAINPNMPNPIYYSVISGLYHMVGITMTSLILVLMK